MRDVILKILEAAIDESTANRKQAIDKSDFQGIRLYGTGAIFDSMRLVNFLVRVEQMIDDELERVVALTSEKAVSMRVSPFSSIRTLTDFILSELEVVAATG